MFENFDTSLISIIEEAKAYTMKQFKMRKIGTESFLYVMFNKEESITRLLLEDYRVNEEEILEVLTSLVIIRSDNNNYTDKLLEVFEMAKAIAKENNSSIILEEHLFFSFLVIKDTIFEAVIKKLNLNSTILIEDLKEYFYIKDQEEIENYTVNLTKLAKEEKLNKIYGRKDYLLRMKTILKRKTKNNMLLVGSAGVGKTALVEGLCYELLAEGSKYEVVSVNVSSLVANTKYRGDFEARINKVLDEVISKGEKILFIDEIHTIVGAGSSDNHLDIANIIKPYLARENFICIGATTMDEYLKSINKDKALARRFQTIFVNELSVEETKSLLIQILRSFEEFHNLFFDLTLLDYLLKLAKEKIINRKFPDKAIDLLDEAMSVAKVNNHSKVISSDIITAIKNICGIDGMRFDYDYKYKELEPYFYDNFLGVNLKKNLINIKYVGVDHSTLLNELCYGFGISGEAILELNLATYKETHSISSLIGSPPGYVGFEDGGVLSEHFAKTIYQIVVFKNMNEANSEIKSFITSLIENGYFYDKKGREFKTINTVFVTVEKEIISKSIGFISSVRSVRENYDLVLNDICTNVVIDPYVKEFSFLGYEINYDKRLFEENKTSFKRCFIKILKEYKKGKYDLVFNNLSKEIEIIHNS